MRDKSSEIKFRYWEGTLPPISEWDVQKSNSDCFSKNDLQRNCQRQKNCQSLGKTKNLFVKTQFICGFRYPETDRNMQIYLSKGRLCF